MIYNTRGILGAGRRTGDAGLHSVDVMRC